MKKSHLDLATDEITRILGNVKSFIMEENKDVQPYQTEKMSDSDIVAKYLEVDPRVKEQLMLQKPEEWNNFEQIALKKMEGMKHG